MMQKLKEEITAAANRELNRANEQAKSLLMRYAPDIYETEFEEIPEA